MLAGILATLSHYVLYRLGCMHYGSALATDFYGGFYGFSTNIVVALIASWFESKSPREQAEGLAIGAGILVTILNIIFC